MLQSFKNILVPVDFTLNTEVAINKTLELVDYEGATIHLLHVCRPSGYSFKKNGYDDSAIKMNQWKESIEDYNSDITVQCWISEEGSVQKNIKEKAERIGADLIVIGQTSSHHWLPVLKKVLPMQIGESTGIPVLTVKPGALHNKMKTVVVPIADDLPNIKMNALEALSKKGKLNIHLITLVDDSHQPSDFSASALLQVYQWLKLKLHCPVEYSVVHHGNNRAKAILQYAEKTNADILLVHPEKETRIGWGNRHICDVIPSASKVQVLAV